MDMDARTKLEHSIAATDREIENAKSPADLAYLEAHRLRMLRELMVGTGFARKRRDE